MTPKQRMLNAYRGLPVDKTPVAPEFWMYYPARLLGVNMIEFEKETLFWQALKFTFEYFGCEGWGIASDGAVCPAAKSTPKMIKLNEKQYQETVTTIYKGATFEAVRRFDADEPSWLVKPMVSDVRKIPAAIDMRLDDENYYDFTDAINAYDAVSESYLLGMYAGDAFFDFIAGLTGFEAAAKYFCDEDEAILNSYLNRYTEYHLISAGLIVKLIHYGKDAEKYDNYRR